MVSRRAKSEAQTINLSLNFPTNYDLSIILQQIPTPAHSFHAVTCNIQLQLLRCV